MMQSIADFYNYSRVEKRTYIENELRRLSEPEDELELAQNIASVINNFIEEYIEYKYSLMRGTWNNDTQSLCLEKQISDFWPIARNSLRRAYDESTNVRVPNNIYDLFGATKLTFSNKVIRSLNSKMGLLWESLASISPFVINPEVEFGLKIKGIDIIAKNVLNNDIEYIQIKTQRNTLTGSQTSRSNAELNIHENPVFATCFPLAAWTFSSAGNVIKVSGAQFWERIDMDYELICEHAEILIQDCEGEYLRLLSL